MKLLYDYEPVIGLEIHAELLCESKIFCACSTEFGAAPNTHVCPVCLGLPGALPTLNRRAAELGVRAGIALGCKIHPISRFDRKNYFYPDLPKAYQITQFFQPLCTDGRLRVPTARGELSVGITRIHLEEDAGKLIHEGAVTRMDANRCGVPLIEIVTEPEIHTPEDGADFAEALRRILLFAGVCDGKMQEGSLRCDVNLSLRPKGSNTLGTRTEMKNINSFTFIRKAIEYEYARQAEILHSGGRVIQETRRFDAATGRTESMRSKEETADYRYFPEANLPALYLSPEHIEKIRREMPVLPAQYREEFLAAGVSPADGELLLSSPGTAAYFRRALGYCPAGGALCALLLHALSAREGFCDRVDATRLAQVTELFISNRINNSTARSLLSRLYEGDFDPETVCDRENLWLITDRETLRAGVVQVLFAESAAVESYRRGKAAAGKMLMGKCMGYFAGKAEPKLLESLLYEALSE